MTQSAEETVTRRKRAPMKKQIYDWSDLVAAFASPPVVPVDEVSAYVRRMINDRGFEHAVQLTDRLVAVASETDIDLLWAATPRGGAINDTRLTECVSVRPAAGGRTTYAIDNTVDGHFANKHLPLSARERAGGGRRTHRSTQWFCGRGGIYQKGQGPHYSDVGPDFTNLTIEQFEKELQEAVPNGVPEQWAQSASAFGRRVAAAVAPFKDAIVRYEHWLPNADEYADDIAASHMRFFAVPRAEAVSGRYSAPYGIRVRIKSPHSIEESSAIDVPDFSAFAIGPDMYREGSAEIMYGAELLHATGRRSVAPYHTSGRRFPGGTGLPLMLYRKPNEVIDAARRWAAERVFIPV